MRLVVDTSALVAIATEEPECDSFIEQLEAADENLISPMNYVEAGVVLTTHGLFTSRDAIDAWLADYRVQIAREPAIEAAALDAYLKFGKGRHPAKLNLADCFAYALAKSLDAPLLYKGDDFPLTDVRSALD
ncbi:twitching motility protein PilT [Caulobacter sp. Root1455]|uniref:type II toxin-antitoxin system VapC family toxin n=1 Tax=unclassified Caulobacter TaxID=2648921 RepID=UPI0006F9B810|nr:MULTISPECIES: type II toxin-antitoxin system VapC family toxin [unclassified Caulobacter]KQY35672.1 twitching motility protein PilT [Caulobacter sp. Root487D2Y]KQZ06363.1 twitching motility protein PilT [Caulobacter sp. Root1455]